MKSPTSLSHTKSHPIGLPDYYITPTRDFTQYTRDCEQKYWRKETAFDWGQDVVGNLKSRLEKLSDSEFSRLAFIVLPMVSENLKRKIAHIGASPLPDTVDALKDIDECLPDDCGSIRRALDALAPLQQIQSEKIALMDQLDIYQKSLTDLREEQRLGVFRIDTTVKKLETEAESRAQQAEILNLEAAIRKVQEEMNTVGATGDVQAEKFRSVIRNTLDELAPQVLRELQSTQDLLLKTLHTKQMPDNPAELQQLKDLVLKRQVHGLKDIANHALVVEQSAIAPLTMGIIHYKRHREIQEALTTFIQDEAKHSATFRRFLVEKLGAKEFVSAILIKGANRYMWLARFFPGTGMLLAVIVESIGAAYLEFFGNEKYMPDPLFYNISKTISEKDEQRHMDLCVAIYNELYRTGSRWEQIRNKFALRSIMRAVYGDKTEDHHLIQAFLAFGVEAEVLYNHIMNRLCLQLARIGMRVEPADLLAHIGK